MLMLAAGMFIATKLASAVRMKRALHATASGSGGREKGGGGGGGGGREMQAAITVCTIALLQCLAYFPTAVTCMAFCLANESPQFVLVRPIHLLMRLVSDETCARRQVQSWPPLSCVPPSPVLLSVSGHLRLGLLVGPPGPLLSHLSGLRLGQPDLLGGARVELLRVHAARMLTALTYTSRSFCSIDTCVRIHTRTFVFTLEFTLSDWKV